MHVVSTPPSGIVRVGRDMTAEERWAAVGTTYAKGLDGPYHRHRLAVFEALLPELAGKTVLDFGCGEGILIRRIRELGAASVVGIDIDPGLLKRAEGSGADQLVLGGTERLSEIESADCVIAANVAAYFTDDQDATFYREVARILGSQGSLVITHSNELFDLFTMNAFTANFFAANFDCDVSSLLERPTEPARKSFNVRENPLTYGHKLARFSLGIEQMEFISHHATPPLLADCDWDDINGREYRDTLEVPPSERWKLAFQCSMFGVRVVPTAAPLRPIEMHNAFE